MEIRKYQAEDLEEIVQPFYETIQTVNRKDYSQEQVEVWSNRCENLRKNKTFFEKLYTVVAVEGEKIIGYGNIDRTGYLDHLFVHKDFQNQGVATAICDELEQIGAGSVVTKDIPDYSVAIGNPARVIKRYDINKQKWIRI